jgi:hypothetical protein
MKRIMVILAIFFGAGAAISADLEVAEGVITTGVSNQAPMDSFQEYPAAVGTLYCFTRITGADAESAVVHVWLWEGQEMARVELPVRSSNWRTWSSKTVLPQWVGQWQVEVLDRDGTLLKTIAFSLN